MYIYWYIIMDSQCYNREKTNMSFDAFQLVISVMVYLVIIRCFFFEKCPILEKVSNDLVGGVTLKVKQVSKFNKNTNYHP